MHIEIGSALHKPRLSWQGVVKGLERLYGAEINETFRCADWDQNHEQGKAGFVLGNAAKDWYWIEDPIFDYEREALAASGQLDRYICVEPHGPWGFLEAVNELFSSLWKAGKRHHARRRQARVV